MASLCSSQFRGLEERTEAKPEMAGGRERLRESQRDGWRDGGRDGGQAGALTLSFPPLSSSLIFRRASTVLFRSLCMRRPKSLNMVEPPDRTMFWRNRAEHYRGGPCLIHQADASILTDAKSFEKVQQKNQ